MRKHLGWYLKGLPGSAMVRAKLQTMLTASDLLHTLDEFERALAQGRVKATEADFGGGQTWED
jgi:tRNA-dihydrouridine synthase